MDKGYADSANLSAPPDFDCAKFKQSVRELAFAAIVKQPTVSNHGKVPTDGSLALVCCYRPFMQGWPGAPGHDGRGREDQYWILSGLRSHSSNAAQPSARSSGWIGMVRWFSGNGIS
jgi:hypothetical protein